jgi:hypothetical protein
MTPGHVRGLLEFRPSDGAEMPVAFVVGPGTAGDGGDADLIVLHVRSG